MYSRRLRPHQNHFSVTSELLRYVYHCFLLLVFKKRFTYISYPFLFFFLNEQDMKQQCDEKRFVLCFLTSEVFILQFDKLSLEQFLCF